MTPKSSISPSPLSLTEPGRYVVGCNYWASHAGTAMWSNWRADVVEEDLRQLAGAGLEVLRVFLMWPDFQPLSLLYGGHSRPEQFRHGELPLPFDKAGEAGVSAAAMEHFQTFADLAEKQNLKLLVGLVTGWMSGRMFVPPALQGRNPITDPVSIRWQVRLVKHFVNRFRSHGAILAWDLGNECNCMGPSSQEQAWVWSAAIADAIRAEDPSRPIVSGMHSLLPNRGADWRIQDQGELTDVLTTHPYPVFTPHCDLDPITGIRSGLHATAESRMYADIGRKPCLVEELGTLGPMICSEKISADYIRTVLLSSWAHDCHGLLWWCAYDQVHLPQAPYDWHPLERELGLFRNDRSAKPVLAEFTRFGQFIRDLPVAALPPRRTDAVCILSEGQDSWAAAYGSFILAKQAGFDIEFQHMDQPLKDARCYLLPSLGGSGVSRAMWLDLLDRVQKGATLYVSLKDAMLSPFTEPTGLEVQTRQRRSGPAQITLDFLPQRPVFGVGGPLRLNIDPKSAEVLAREADGNPVLTCSPCGRGRIYLLTVPLETDLATTAGAFDGPTAKPAWEIYRHLAEPLLQSRAVRKTNPLVGLTEHAIDAGTRVIVAINYSPTGLQETLTLAPGWQFDKTWRGAAPTTNGKALSCAIAQNDAVAFTLKKV